MNQKGIERIEKYLQDEELLYRDWYESVIQVQDDQYTTPAGIKDNLEKIKQHFEKSFIKIRDELKENVCPSYCQKIQEESQKKLQIRIILVAEYLTYLSGFPFDIITTATILVHGEYLDRLCKCSK